MVRPLHLPVNPLTPLTPPLFNCCSVLNVLTLGQQCFYMMLIPGGGAELRIVAAGPGFEPQPLAFQCGVCTFVQESKDIPRHLKLNWWPVVTI